MGHCDQPKHGNALQQTQQDFVGVVSIPRNRSLKEPFFVVLAWTVLAALWALWAPAWAIFVQEVIFSSGTSVQQVHVQMCLHQYNWEPLRTLSSRFGWFWWIFSFLWIETSLIDRHWMWRRIKIDDPCSDWGRVNFCFWHIRIARMYWANKLSSHSKW